MKNTNMEREGRRKGKDKILCWAPRITPKTF